MDDKVKWNGRYEARISGVGELVPNSRLEGVSSYLSGGKALDVACGLGANSIFLAEKNYQVKAVDISDVAIHFIQDRAEELKLDIHAEAMDLVEIKNLKLLDIDYDLVLTTYYLDRTLFPLLQSLVKVNGYFFMETYFQSPLSQTQSISNQYKLQSNELLQVFHGWKVLFFEENELEGRQTIFCQRK